MRMSEIKKKALDMGFDPKNMKKDDLIRNIQTREGYEPCYKIKTTHCEHFDCCWRNDCKPV